MDNYLFYDTVRNIYIRYNLIEDTMMYATPKWYEKLFGVYTELYFHSLYLGNRIYVTEDRTFVLFYNDNNSIKICNNFKELLDFASEC